MGEGT